MLSSIYEYWSEKEVDVDGTSLATLLLTLAYLEFYLDNTPQVTNYILDHYVLENPSKMLYFDIAGIFLRII